MPVERFVLLGLAQVRSAWFREAARWSTAASLPIEFVKTMSTEEVRARLRSGRPYSALLVDDTVPGLDRDLVDLAAEVGCSVIVVDSGRTARRWGELGVAATLSPDLDPTTLLQVLGQVAQPLAQGEDRPQLPGDASPPLGFRGHLVVVTGPGGTGASTVAIGLAQQLAADPRQAGLVCLADLVRHGEQAMLHGSPDVVPGLQELVDAHRTGLPSSEAIRSLLWRIDARGYDLLLGLRRHRDWTALRPRAVGAALDGLRRSYRIAVCDADPDVEGEQATGSVDVEERNALSRAAVEAAELVVVVGGPGMKGIHALLRTARELIDHGVPAGSLLPVVNRAPKSPRARAELARAFGDLLGAVDDRGRAPVASPIFLTERRHLDTLLRDRARLPESWVRPLAGAVLALLDERPTRAGAPLDLRTSEPLPVAPGSLGSWTEQGHDVEDAG